MPKRSKGEIPFNWPPPPKIDIKKLAASLPKTPQKEMDEILQRRERAIRSLLKSLERLSRERQFTILCSWLSLEELEDLAKFQDRKE